VTPPAARAGTKGRDAARCARAAGHLARRALLALAGLAAAGCGFDAYVISAADAGADAGADAVAIADVVADAVADLGDATGVFAGQEFTCALDGGRGFCFGANVDGALGSGDDGTHIAPVAVAAAFGFDALTAGENHACGLQHGTGDVWCWGYNAAGQLGLGDLDARAAPARVPLGQPSRGVAAGYNHTCAIAADQSLWCWGDNTEGQLGQDDAPGAPSAASPVRVGAAADWLAVAGGQGHTCAIEAPGTMWCWGRNTDGETGTNPSLEQVRGPAQVGTFADWVSLDVGQGTSCGLRADGTLWCWGDNSFGQQAAAPESAPVPAPRQVGGDADWARVSVDAFSGCAVKADQSLWCWGRNAEGQLGVGDTTDRYQPAQVAPQTAWAAASVGRFHACAAAAGGGAYCMGENSNGQLGLGDTSRRNVPTLVTIPR
jgi:alpha-tubulin suppressor-like RCC1 family protein